MLSGKYYYWLEKKKIQGQKVPKNYLFKISKFIDGVIDKNTELCCGNTHAVQ